MAAHETWVRSLGEGAQEKIAALTAKLEDGITIDPVYTTSIPWKATEAAFIDRAPRTRVIERRLAPSAANVMDAIEGGAEGLWAPAEALLRSDALTALLAAPIEGWLFLDGNAEAFEAVASRIDAAGEAARRWTLVPSGGSPVGRSAATGARRFVQFHSGAPAHAAGASPAFELGMIAASCFAAWRRAATDAASLGDVVRGTALGVVAEADILVTVAKVRALRLLWGKLQGAAGVRGSAPVVCGLSSERRQAALDIHTNLIRNATEVFGLVVGGVDACVALPFDALLEAPSALGQRLARNTILMARDEAFLGLVNDPAGGSHYLESLTRALAERAWEALRFIEREGGTESGAVKSKLAAYAEARARDLAERRSIVVGVNDFAATDEALPSKPRAEVLRDTAAFEATAERSRALGGPRVGIVSLGKPSGVAARKSFARRFFEAGRFVVDDTLPIDAPIEAVLAMSDTVDLVCLCGPDDAYVTQANTLLAPLVARGVPVWMAGRPKALDEKLRASLAGQIYIGCHAIEAMDRARTQTVARRAKRGEA